MPKWLAAFLKESQVRQCVAHWFILFGIPGMFAISSWVLITLVRLGNEMARMENATVTHGERISQLERWMFEVANRGRAP